MTMPARKYKTNPAELLAEGQHIVHTTSDVRYQHIRDKMTLIFLFEEFSRPDAF